jgi:hypothetical protein
MGPGPPKKNGDKSSSKNASQKALNTGGQGSSYAGSTAMSTDPSSSPTAVTEEGSRISGDGWNRKRYQREDEALWGLDFQGPGQRIMDAIAKAGSSASRLLESRLSKSGDGSREESPGTYYMARNPPVNDLHPPVVSTQPASRGETRWMLQPPPAAKIMEGKERVNRSRAGSNGSSRKGGADEPPLSRQLTGKLVDAKLQRGETPYLDERSTPSRRTKTPTTSKPKAQRHDRERSSSVDSSSSSDGAFRRKRRPPPISISTSGMSSRDTLEHVPIPSSRSSTLPPRSAESEMRENSKRPVLPTIVSSSKVVPQALKKQEPLRELSSPSTSNTLNSQSQFLSHRLSPNVNAMPASIPSMESKFPGATTYRFPRPASIENAEPPNPV